MMRFSKMQGAGNDYIYIDCFSEKVDNPSALAKTLSDRHFGVGGDGLILICPSDTADFRMDFYNADGSRAQMCGNGIRCLGKYVYERGLTDKLNICVQTLSAQGTHAAQRGRQNCVGDGRYGEPALRPDLIPVMLEGESVVSRPLRISGSVEVTCVSLGNPHAVVIMDEIDYLVLTELGPKFENHPAFPQRTNAEFVQILAPDLIKTRTWERAVGETLASGTGASAAVVASILNGRCARDVTVLVRGGRLSIKWDESDNHVYLTMPSISSTGKCKQSPRSRPWIDCRTARKRLPARWNDVRLNRISPVFRHRIA